MRLAKETMFMTTSRIRDRTLRDFFSPKFHDSPSAVGIRRSGPVNAAHSKGY